MQFKFRKIRAGRIQQNGNASVLCPRQKNDHNRNRRTDDVGTRHPFVPANTTTPPLNTVFNTVNSFAHLPQHCYCIVLLNEIEIMLTRRLAQGSYRKASRGLLVSSSTCQNITGTTTTRRRDDDDEKSALSLQKRFFRASPKSEILPLIAAGSVLMIGRWSWKASNRMNEEWEDYQWQLQQYERQRLKNAEDGAEMITIGVDLGSLYLKLSTLSANKPELVTTAQGDRYRFTGILTGNDNGELITGAPALEKFFYQPEGQERPLEEPVILPYRQLQNASHDEAASLVQRVFVPVVGEAMDRLAEDKQVRTVLTLAPTFYNQHGETLFQNYHDEKHHTTTVPDPVAAIWGAQILDLMPTPQSKEENESSTLVVDIGGLVTTVSLVKNDVVVTSCTLDDIGAETYVQQLVYRILKEADDETLSRDAISLSLISSSARSATLELVNKTEANVHIPFLFMGRKAKDLHLDMNVSRSMLDQAVQDYWASEVIPKLVGKEILSTALPPPTSAATLITSAVTKVLEDSGETPSDVQHILLVGGGSRHALLEKAFKDGVAALMGPNLQKLVLPETSLRAELTVLGASSLLPNFDYSYDNGLERV
jgi:hypothetical protein